MDTLSTVSADRWNGNHIQLYIQGNFWHHCFPINSRKYVSGWQYREAANIESFHCLKMELQMWHMALWLVSGVYHIVLCWVNKKCNVGAGVTDGKSSPYDRYGSTNTTTVSGWEAALSFSTSPINTDAVNGDKCYRRRSRVDRVSKHVPLSIRSVARTLEHCLVLQVVTLSEQLSSQPSLLPSDGI